MVMGGFLRDERVEQDKQAGPQKKTPANWLPVLNL
jgi:hypothetical protein